MMMNLFNIFDPATSPHYSFNWMSALIVFIVLPYPFWMQSSRYMMMWILTIKYLIKEFKAIISHSFSNLIIFLSLFIMILTNNFMGLFPYVFTTTSHLSVCLTLSLTLWSGMMMFSIINYFNDLCAHLTPQGTPFILMPFMVIIETISLIIRPITLAVRLTANMIAGHLLLTLLGSAGMETPVLYLPFLILTQIMLYILEMSVAMIQAYVFSVLITLYSSET